ncbi:hypothetical protein PR048_010724 [Dryococelus australis]|uniref:Uncharacterized protein n=1 Tax=Dryococelus australis TaxID=614101 RepID=A0ABQ9I3H7_9NEOP|nr:hypothetical protein PR048_010724 [Dryococelus australis]
MFVCMTPDSIQKAQESSTHHCEFRHEIVQVYLSRFANPSKGLGKQSTSSSKSRIPEDQFDCLNHLVKKMTKEDAG